MHDPARRSHGSPRDDLRVQCPLCEGTHEYVLSFDQAPVPDGSLRRGSGRPVERGLALLCPVRDRPFRLRIVVRYPYHESALSSVRLVVP